MTIRGRILNLHPATLVLCSFLLVIVVGTLLLKLPMATAAGRLAWHDALFTATSAVCVTGLVVVDTGRFFTHFGQLVILALIQIGGLGLMTISVTLFTWIGRSVSFRQRMIMQDLFAHTPRSDIFDLVKSIVLFTAVAEFIGGVILTVFWSYEMPLRQAAYTGFFHAISAFCNAGFALYADSMMPYSGDLLLNGTLCALIVLGGIGFPVLYDLQCWFKFRKRQRCRLSIQTKTVLLTTAILITASAGMFAFLEQFSSGVPSSLGQRILTPLFQSVTCRTAGFNTVDIAALKDATLAMMIGLMFFGASPGSCGGGVKTTTLALLTAFTLSRLRRRRRVDLFKKSVPHETVTRSIALVLVAIGVIGLVLFMILVGNAVDGSHTVHARGAFLPLLFETVSAFGTVGLSMGVTPDLNLWGQCWIIAMMLIGRVGVLTFAYIIVGSGADSGVEHAEENLMIG
jgi:trk system potassium uptake protein TrkH